MMHGSLASIGFASERTLADPGPARKRKSARLQKSRLLQ